MKPTCIECLNKILIACAVFAVTTASLPAAAELKYEVAVGVTSSNSVRPCQPLQDLDTDENGEHHIEMYEHPPIALPLTLTSSCNEGSSKAVSSAQAGQKFLSAGATSYEATDGESGAVTATTSKQGMVRFNTTDTSITTVDVRFNPLELVGGLNLNCTDCTAGTRVVGLTIDISLNAVSKQFSYSLNPNVGCIGEYDNCEAPVAGLKSFDLLKPTFVITGVPVNTDVPLLIKMGVSASARGAITHTTFDKFGFRNGQNVFNLTDGVTAESADFFIYDNVSELPVERLSLPAMIAAAIAFLLAAIAAWRAWIWSEVRRRRGWGDDPFTPS